MPCRADEPDAGAALESLLVACERAGLREAAATVEVVVCVNGVAAGGEEERCAPRAAVRAVCGRARVPLRELWLPARGERGERGFRCTVLLTESRGKPLAWNAIWRWAEAADTVIFCDADVRVEPEAVVHLLARAERDPSLRLVAAREIPLTDPRATLWSRLGAIPYRFDFGNAGGRLYLIRKDALGGDGMPEDLLLEDAWLTVAVGRQRVAKETAAKVFFLPPGTWRDYFAERVRTEGGKIQIGRLRPTLGSPGSAARYRWGDFWRGIAVREYPLVMLALAVRAAARVWARLRVVRRGYYSLYRPFGSTKGWGSVSSPW
jgi:glycosyltransferase involved in cell wall biosynthesis